MISKIQTIRKKGIRRSRHNIFFEHLPVSRIFLTQNLWHNFNKRDIYLISYRWFFVFVNLEVRKNLNLIIKPQELAK